MDPNTVILILSLNLIGIGGLLLLISRRMADPAGLRGFAVGEILFGMSNLSRLAVGYTSGEALVLASDAGMIVATLCFASGVRQFSRLPPVGAGVIAVAVGLYLAVSGAAIALWPETGRHVVLNFALFLTYGTLALMALSGARREARNLALPMRVFAVLIGILSLATLGRSVTAAVAGSGPLFHGLAAQAFYVYGAVFTVLLGPNLLWMVFVRLNDRMTMLATHDPLTGLLNRNGLDEALKRHFGIRPPLPLVLMQVDVDHFKKVNDSHGHAVGDAVLKSVADTLVAQVRGSDFVARLGGEEFLVCCVGADIARASAQAERLRQAVSGCRHALDGGEALACTVSIGVSGILLAREGWDGALRQADRALYEAKAAGRNRVMPVCAEASATAMHA